MRTRVLLCCVCVLFVFSLLPASAQEQSEADKKIMDIWMKYATPGEGHKFLQKMAGEWEVVSKLWEKPGQEPTLTNGPGKAKMIMGGRYLEIVYQGTMMGMPFKGKSVYGYDNNSKKYFSTWIDNMGTGLMVTWGTIDKTGKILTEFGEVDDIFTGKKIKVKNVITLIDADKWQTEMYMLDPKGEFKSVEVIHTRKK